MIAVLVITVVRLLAPVAEASLGLARALGRARAAVWPRSRAGEPRPLISVARPSWSPAPYQIRPSTVERRGPGSKAAQPPLGAELEERVGLEPRLLGLLVLAGARRPPRMRSSEPAMRS